MVVCKFFLEGRCRYGEKCWNEHPRGGSRGYTDSYSRSSGQQQPRGGFGNRVWVNPSQQKGSYIRESSFSSAGGVDDWGHGGGSDWGGGGGGRRDNKSSEFSFSSQNRFAALNSSSTFDRGGRGTTDGDDENNKKLEIIQADMDVWEKSRQWGFSCYSNAKTPLSGFTDLSPEELRLEYYNARATGDLQGYINGVNQLLSQWKSRVQELKIMNAATRVALIAELNGAGPQAPPTGFGSTTPAGFGSSTSGFGNKGFGAPAPVQANSFSFSSSNPGFGSATTGSSSSGFVGGFTTPTQPPSGFGSSSAPSASAFSFAAPTTDKPASAAPTGFGSASGFSLFSTPSTGTGFRGAFGATAPATAASSSDLGATSGGFGAAAATTTPGSDSAGEAKDSLFSPESKLTEEELNQFKANRFTLGQIPLKPPPANMLVVG
ncbi:nucleoporin NUP42 [Pholidichthys leucotaenia]